MPTNVLNPIVDMYQTQLEASRQFGDAIFSGTEKIDRVIIEATHRAFTEQLKFAQALAATRDPSGMANLQSSFRPDNAVNYQKEILRIFAEMQNDIGRSVQEYVQQLGRKTVNTATMPIGAAQEQASDAVFNPVTGMFSVWESAFKEVAALANKNMVAARSTFENAANAATTAAANASNAAGSAMNAAVDDTEEEVVEERKTTSGSRRK